MFFCLFFFAALINFFKIGQKFFIWSPSLTFLESCQMFFIWSPSLTFPKIGSMFFFPKYFFFRPPLLDFGFFSGLKQRNNTQWPKAAIYH